MIWGLGLRCLNLESSDSYPRALLHMQHLNVICSETIIKTNKEGEGESCIRKEGLSAAGSTHFFFLCSLSDTFPLGFFFCLSATNKSDNSYIRNSLTFNN